jgi:hypothetical protein
MATENFEKLVDCVEISGVDIKRGDHFLYTSTKYKEEGRKCVYAVCYGSQKGKLTCNSYVPKGEEKQIEDWVITVSDKWKKYRFYKRQEKEKSVQVQVQQAEPQQAEPQQAEPEKLKPEKPKKRLTVRPKKQE